MSEYSDIVGFAEPGSNVIHLVNLQSPDEMFEQDTTEFSELDEELDEELGEFQSEEDDLELEEETLEKAGEPLEMEEQTQDTDENAKEPAAKPGKEEEKTVEIPIFEDAERNIFHSCRDHMVAAINEKIDDMELAQILRAPIVSKSVTRDDCRFTNFRFWRMNQTDVLVDVDAHVNLLVAGAQGDVVTNIGIAISLWMSVMDEFEWELYSLEKLEDREDRPYTQLDRKLVPLMLDQEAIEDSAERIWLDRHPKAMEDAMERRPFILAEKYGLKIRKERIAHCAEEYVLFFKRGKLDIIVAPDPGERAHEKMQTIDIEEKTIVLNECRVDRDDGELAIYEACYQYEWHYLFYAYNNCVNTRIDQFEIKKLPTEKARDEKDVRRILQWQAADGGIGLMMPYSIIHEKLFREAQIAVEKRPLNGYDNHIGFRMENAIHTIVDEYQLRPYRVKSRAIRIGFPGAKGALNYDSDCHRYFPAFTFSQDYKRDCKDRDKDEIKSEAFFIPRKKLYLLYLSNKEFRGVMSTGEFAYVDGLVCVNDEDYIRLLAGEWAMARKANREVDTCCVRFNRIYSGKQYAYYFNAKRFKPYNEIMRRHCKLTMQEKEELKKKITRELPKSFPKALQFLMNNNPDGLRFTETALTAKTGIPKEVIHQYCTDKDKVYMLDEVVAICVGLNLPPWLSNLILKKANMEAPRTGALAYYGMIIDCLYRENVKTIQSFLENNGIPILRIK